MTGEKLIVLASGFGLAGFLAWKLVKSLRKGEITLTDEFGGNRETFYRHVQDPGQYWLWVFVLGALVIGVAALEVFILVAR
jgi:hypothetical protein